MAVTHGGYTRGFFCIVSRICACHGGYTWRWYGGGPTHGGGTMAVTPARHHTRGARDRHVWRPARGLLLRRARARARARRTNQPNLRRDDDGLADGVAARDHKLLRERHLQEMPVSPEAHGVTVTVAAAARAARDDPRRRDATRRGAARKDREIGRPNPATEE